MSSCRHLRWIVVGTRGRVPRLALCALGIAIVGAAGAHAQPVGYAVQSDGDDQLYSIDLGSGVATAIGPSGFGDIDGLTFDLAGTTLYGIDTSSDQLVTCSTATGACTAVGPLGAAVNATGLTFGCDGNLYMGNENDQGLYLVDPVSGAATLIGSGSGEDLTALAARSATAGCASGLFGVGDDSFDALVCLDPITGIAAPIGDLGIVSSDGGLDFDGAGVLWFLDDDGNLYNVDATTGAASPAGSTDAGFEGLAIAADTCGQGPPPPPPPSSILEVPTLSPWGMLGLSGLIAAAALVFLRRRSLA